MCQHPSQQHLIGFICNIQGADGVKSVSDSNEVVTDPRLEKRTRRRFSVAEKKRLLAEAGALPHGEKGAWLRRQGLYVDNMHYMGGCLLGDNLSEATVMFAFNSLPPDPGIVGERWRDLWFERLKGSGLWVECWLRHQRRTAYWKASSIRENYAAIQCPAPRWASCRKRYAGGTTG